MSKHTPGPWYVENGNVYAPVKWGVPRKRIAMPDRQEEQIRPVERDANAHLIAAAPELLEATKMAVGFIHIAQEIAKHILLEEAEFSHVGWQGLVKKCKRVLNKDSIYPQRSYAKTLIEKLTTSITKAEGREAR